MSNTQPRVSIVTPISQKSNNHQLKVSRMSSGGSISHRSQTSRQSISSQRKKYSVLDGSKLQKRQIPQDKTEMSREARRLVKQISKKEQLDVKNKLQRENMEKSLENNINNQNEIVQYRMNEPVPIRSNLAIELEDPGNEYLRPEIQKVLHITSEINSIAVDYANLHMTKEDFREEIEALLSKDYSRKKVLNFPNTCKLVILL